MLKLVFSFDMFVLVFVKVIPYHCRLKCSKPDENKYVCPSKVIFFHNISPVTLTYLSLAEKISLTGDL